MYGKKLFTFVAAIAVATGCSSPPPEVAARPSAPSNNAPIGWPVRTAEYVDLWLHGYALITIDTTKVPLFDRGYRDRMLQVRRQRNVVTGLDANRQTLQDGLLRNPELGNGQFAIFSFASFDEVLRITQQFIRNEGSPSTVSDATTQQLFLTLRSTFRTVADREWLRLFVTSLEDEQNRFYLSYWNAQQVDRAPVRQAVETAWNNTYKAKFQRYLRNERLIDGTFILSLPIGGEGRSIFSASAGNGIATPLPETREEAMAAIYTFTHEIAGSAAQRAVEDNLTPAQVREGGAARMIPIAAVRAGALLLQRIAPELVQGYQAYYLRQSGAAVPGGDSSMAFTAAFELPQAVVDGIARQIDLVLGGI